MPTHRKTKSRRTPSRERRQSRGLTEPSGLGQQLLDTVENIIELMEHAQDPDRLKELNAERKALSNEARRLIDANLDASSAEYQQAVAGLEQASSTVRQAIKGLESIKNAILMAAKALEFVAKVVSVV